MIGRAMNGEAARVVDTLVQENGPRAAAWLVGRRECRRKLHETGALLFHALSGARLPGWFQNAIFILRNRPRWEVVFQHDTDGRRTWAIHWRERGKRR